MTVLSCFDGRLPILLAAAVRLASGTSDFMPDQFTVASGRYFSFTVNGHIASATGRNNYGQLGIGTSEGQVLVPTEVQFPSGDPNATSAVDVLDIAAGAFHTIFLTTEGEVYVSGWNKHGQLGVATPDGMAKDPTLVTIPDEPSAKAVAVAAGYAHSLVVLDSGSVYAMGLNRAGQLGDGSTTSSSIPKKVDNLPEATGVAAGYDFSYFLLRDKRVFASGQNLGGQLGDGTRTSSSTPVQVKNVENVVSVAAGESHGLFRLEDQSVYGTGANFIGQLGRGQGAPETPVAEPLKLDSADESNRVYAGKDTSCVVKGATWDVYCMGDNHEGQLGFKTQTSQREPKLVPGVSDFVEGVGLGYAHGLFLAHPGDVYVTGTNDFGELGTNNTEGRNEVIKNELMKLDFQETTRTTTLPPTTTAAETTPSPTRDPNANPGVPQRELVWIWVGAILIGVIALVINVLFQRQGARQMEDEDDVPNQNELELMRNELDA